MGERFRGLGDKGGSLRDALASTCLGIDPRPTFWGVEHVWDGGAAVRPCILLAAASANAWAQKRRATASYMNTSTNR